MPEFPSILNAFSSVLKTTLIYIKYIQLEKCFYYHENKNKWNK